MSEELLEAVRVTRTTADNPDFHTLVGFLDEYLRVVDGDEHTFYNQYNQIHNIPHVVLAYRGSEPVGCGAIKPWTTEFMEVKRMFVQPAYRGQGIARKVLSELEHWGRELGYTGFVLETGKKQQEAIRLYQASGYEVIPNYGQYAGVENSVCLRKYLAESL